MTVELGAIVGLAGLCISFAAFYIGRTTASKKEGRAAGMESAGFSKDIQYIKDSLGRIEKGFEAEISKLGGRVDELGGIVSNLATVAEKARSSAKSAHYRLNAHERADHGKPVNDWREEMDE